MRTFSASGSNSKVRTAYHYVSDAIQPHAIGASPMTTQSIDRLDGIDAMPARNRNAGGPTNRSAAFQNSPIVVGDSHWKLTPRCSEILAVATLAVVGTEAAGAPALLTNIPPIQGVFRINRCWPKLARPEFS